MYTIVQWNYRKIATVLKYLCVSLFCYIIIPFLTTTGWTTVLKETIIPDFKWNSDYLLFIRRHPGHNNIAISFFLAGINGSGRRK